MKIVVLSFLLCISCFAQPILVNRDMPADALVTRLFNGYLDQKLHEVAWKPNAGERLTFDAGEGEILYTKVDTTFTWHNGIDHIIIATATFRKDSKGNYLDCHPCAPALGLIYLEEADKGQYKITKFYKYITHYGSWGMPQDIDLLILGKGIPVVVVNWGYTGQGATEGGKTFYYQDTEILNVTTHEDNRGTTDIPDEVFEYDTKMEVDYLTLGLIFTQRGTVYNPGGKPSPVNAVVRYSFNPESKTFKRIEGDD